MLRHGAALEELVWSVVLLDREATARISAEVGSWQTTWDDLGPDVPARFAGLERDLRAQTDTLGELARRPGSTDEQIGRAFARLSATCVACHAQYLYSE